MPEDTKWLVTLTIRMTVGGAETREEAVTAAAERLQNAIRGDVEVPMDAEARRIRSAEEEFPLFGQKWG